MTNKVHTMSLGKAFKKLRKPRRKHNQRVGIMGKSGAHKQDRRAVKSGGHRAKETIRRVGEYKRAKRK